MSEIKRTFLQGKMNKDLDERLVPNGQFVDALNIQVARSEGSDVGSIENTLGNEQKTFLKLTEAKCIGAYSDHANQLVYFFVTAQEKDVVAEYDDKNGSVSILLESTRVNGKTLLNFKTDKLITGIVKVISGKNNDDLLGWTDDNEQPRIINIERAKGYAVDGFEEDDISVIKKPPIYAPTAKLTYVAQDTESNINDKFLCFAYAYRYLDGEMSALSPFTNYAFSPKEFKLNNHTFENEGMQNIFSAVDIEFNTGSKRVTEIMLVVKESNSNTVYVVETFDKKENIWGDNEPKTFRFSNSKIYRVLDQDELFRLYDNVPKKAKAMELIGNRLAYGNYLEGYDLVDIYGENVKMDYNLSLFTKNLEGEELETSLSTLSAENDLWNIDLTDIELKKGTRLSISLELFEKTNGTGTYEGSFDFIINDDFRDVSDLCTDIDFIAFIEGVLTEGFTKDYSDTPPANSKMTGTTGFTIDSFTKSTFTLKAPTVTYEIDNTPADSTDTDFSTQINAWGFGEQSGAYFKATAIDSSCKTNRSYEVAMVYLDEYGRSTTALTSIDNTLFIPHENSVFQNKIRVNINHKPPEWAKHFRFAVKQNKDEYNTIYASVFYEEGLYRWVKLDGANKDKVKEGDTLMVKSDLTGVLEDVVKVRVLEVGTKKENFLSENTTPEGNEVSELEGMYMKIKPNGFDTDFNGDTFKHFEGYDRSTGSPTCQVQPSFGEFNSDGVYVDYPLNVGTRVSMLVTSYDNNDQELFEKEFTVTGNYANFQEWFESEVKDFDGAVKSFEFERSADGELFLYLESLYDGSFLHRSRIRANIDVFFTDGSLVFETTASEALSDVYYEGSQTFDIENNWHTGNIQNQNNLNPAVIELDFFNCYSFGNGVESYRYKDALNNKSLNIDTRPTAKSTSGYREIRRYADITYSEPYVESLGINGLNNFNTSKANYKDDIEKKYGSIQKLFARDTDLLMFQEDKVSKVLYGKELLVGPDGGSNLTAVEKILGSQVMYAGEHGISRNPESFAMSGNTIWFTDEKRNHVCRLAIDGITVISRYGMTDWFRELFASSMNKAKLGCYDPYKNQYVLNSNSQLIYNPILPIDCKDSIRKSNFTGTLVAEIDFGLSTGDAGVNIITNEPVHCRLTWNEIVTETDVATVGALVFDKTGMLPRKATLEIEATEAGTDFEVEGNCVVLQEFTVVSIVKGHSKDFGKTIDNRYKWAFGGYTSPYKHFKTTFPEEGGIVVFNTETNGEGKGYIPVTGSKLIMESFKGYGDTGSFGQEDTLGYLISNIQYDQTEVDDIVALSTTATPDPELTGGGEIINRFEFDVLRPNLEKYLYLIWDYSALTININTHIYIYFDSSGSMNSTLVPLQTMRDTLLKDALLPLYDYDEARYDAQVRVISNSSERTLDMLNIQNETPEGNVISLVFQDEANPVYVATSGWDINTPRTSQFNQDISTLRNRLNGFEPNYYRAVIFQVQGAESYNAAGFKALVEAMQQGTGQYSGTYGLSDRNEFAYKYDIPDGETAQYYKDLVVNTFRELGFEL